MATDAAGHTTPGSSDAPKRAAFLDLSLSIRDPIPVADASARAAALSALAGSTPSVTPSASRPVFFHQANLPKPYRTIWTEDGTNFISTSGHYVWADAAARAAATGMSAGDLGVQLDTKVVYRHNGSAWITTPTCAVLSRSSNQSLTATDQAIIWDVEVSDAAGMHDNSTNPSRITVPIAGIYEVICSYYDNNTSGHSSALARKNGSGGVIGSYERRDSSPNTGTHMKLAFSCALAAGDYIEIMAKHSTAAGVINGGTNELAPALTIKYLSPA